ncbi:MAG: LytR family transcriptional regulator [Ruminococcaceae bacterium]|nr:LytR family transcriptional regulator [Oscillospiraceae bacterium]
MAVKRKSNWYIYFIAFGITMAFAIGIILTFQDFLFPEDRQVATGLTPTGELSDDFRPDASHNFTLLTMIGDEAGAMPQLFMMVSYNAVENTVVFIPLPNGISVADSERTLPNVYAALGGTGAVKAVADATGITCDGYIGFDRAGFLRLVSSFGNVEYDVPKTLMVTDGAVRDAFNAGAQIFSPEAMFRYMYLAEFSEGESYRFSMVGDVLAQLINQNFRHIDSTMLDNYFKIITEVCDTDISQELFTSKKAALLNTVEYGSDIAEFYVPYGEYGEDGSFDIADNSIITITQKCGKTEE